jgi:hypothetical protein
MVTIAAGAEPIRGRATRTERLLSGSDGWDVSADPMRRPNSIRPV